MVGCTSLAINQLEILLLITFKQLFLPIPLVYIFTCLHSACLLMCACGWRRFGDGSGAVGTQAKKVLRIPVSINQLSLSIHTDTL